VSVIENQPLRRVRVIGVGALYVLLLAVALAIPVLHARVVNLALESTRSPILLPAPFLLLKWLSEIGMLLAGAVVFSGFWIWFHPRHGFVISVTLVIMLLLFTTLYGCYAAVLLSLELNHGGALAAGGH
jgi:hypothetical protein